MIFYAGIKYFHWKDRFFQHVFIALDGNKYPTLAAANEVTATINYGSFITQAINFLLMAFVVFMVIRRSINWKKLERLQEAPKAPTEKECPYCKSMIPIKAVRCPHCTSELEK